MPRIFKYLLSITVFIFVFIFLNFNTDVNAYYDPLTTPNNIYGIHIANLSDLSDAANLVNSGGGDWGYVTVVITEDNLNKSLWQNFFDECRDLHLIPILRIASKLENGVWKIPNVEDIDKWVNFLNSLNWVIENRYIIIGNETNHAEEWGGVVNPLQYSEYFKTFSQRLKNSSNDYFVMPAAMDLAAGNTKTTITADAYIDQMLIQTPDLFEYVDGIASHSYPNPGFSGSVYDSGKQSIKGYLWEDIYLKSKGINKNFRYFITETGWVSDNISEDTIANNFTYAYQNVWSMDKNVIAVTPFILNYQQEPFRNFSWKNENGFNLTYQKIKDLPKIKGQPKQKTDIKIIYKNLSTFAEIANWSSGYFYFENQGQIVLNDENVSIKDEETFNMPITKVRFSPAYPGEKRYLGYSIFFPIDEGKYPVKVSLYINGEKKEELYSGFVYSLEPKNELLYELGQKLILHLLNYRDLNIFNIQGRLNSYFKI